MENTADVIVSDTSGTRLIDYKIIAIILMIIPLAFSIHHGSKTVSPFSKKGVIIVTDFEILSIFMMILSLVTTLVIKRRAAIPSIG